MILEIIKGLCLCHMTNIMSLADCMPFSFNLILFSCLGCKLPLSPFSCRKLTCKLGRHQCGCKQCGRTKKAAWLCWVNRVINCWIEHGWQGAMRVWVSRLWAVTMFRDQLPTHTSVAWHACWSEARGVIATSLFLNILTIYWTYKMSKLFQHTSGAQKHTTFAHWVWVLVAAYCQMC